MKRSNKSTLFMVAGTLGFLTTVGLAIYNSRKADHAPGEVTKDVVNQLKEWKADINVSTKDTAKMVGKAVVSDIKPYVPTLVAGGATLFCFWASHQVSVKSITALATSSALTTKLLNDYKQEMKKVLTPEQLDKVRKQVAAKRVEESGNDIKIDHAMPATMDAPGEVTANLIDGEVEHLFYEEWCGRWFRAPLCAVMGAESYVNRSLATSGTATLSQFYGYLGLDGPDMVKGLENTYGWDVEEIGAMDGDYWLDFNHTKAVNNNGEEYYILSWDYSPINLQEKYYL